MDNREYALEWLRYAEMDLTSAEFLLDKRPIPLEIICYHCQQSAEKCLKGLLALHGTRPPKIHDLQSLHDLCASSLGGTETILSYCNALNPYGVQPRYPLEIMLTEEETKQALKNARTVLNFLKPLITTKATIG
jgi:HEPN domain-containing protein